MKASEIKPYATRILVRKYMKPEKVGSLYLNPAWLVDNSRALWEVVCSSPKAEEYLGLTLTPGTILVTLPSRGVYAEGLEDAEEHYFLFAEEIVKIIHYSEEEGSIES